MRVFLLGLLFAGACAREPTSPEGRDGTPSARTDAGSETEAQAAIPYDAQFIDAMIAYAEYTEDLAEVGGRRAQHDELKVYAKNLDAEQEARLSALRNWRKLWYPDAPKRIETLDDAAENVGVPPYQFGVAWRGVVVELNPRNPADVEGVAVVAGAEEWDSNELLTRLRTLPEPAFDPFFTATLVEHDRWGLEAARAALPRLEHAELQTIAHEVMSENLLQINQVGAWRQEWFGAATEGMQPQEPGPGTR